MNQIYSLIISENQLRLNKTIIQAPCVSIYYYKPKKLVPKNTPRGKIVYIKKIHYIILCPQ